MIVKVVPGELGIYTYKLFKAAIGIRRYIKQRLLLLYVPLRDSTKRKRAAVTIWYVQIPSTTTKLWYIK